MLVGPLIFVFFLWTLVLYFLLLPFFTKNTNPTEKMLNDKLSFTAYAVYFVGIVIFQIIQGVVQVLPCNSIALPVRITYVILLTLAAWSIFAMVLFSKELMRIPFANTFGYLYVGKKLQDILQVIVPKNMTNTNILVDTLRTHSLHPFVTSSPIPETSQVNKEFLSEMMKNVVTKSHVDDNYELSTLMRSGTNFVKSLKYINDYTTTIFDTMFITNINETYSALTKEGKEIENSSEISTPIQINLLPPLISLLQILYTRDMVGEFLLLILVGITCIVLTLYIVNATACSAKTLSQIQQSVSEYQQQQQDQQQVTTQTVQYA